MHKTARRIGLAAKVGTAEGKSELRDVSLPEDGESEKKMCGGMLTRYGDKYPAAMKLGERPRRIACLLRFSGGALGSVRTTNLIESAFAYSAASPQTD